MNFQRAINFQHAVPAMALLIGIAMAGLAFVLPQSHRVWSDDDAKNYSDAAADLHRLTYEEAIIRAQANQSASPTVGKSPAGSSPLIRPADAPTPIDPTTASLDRATATLEAAKKRYEAARAALEGAQARGRSPISLLLWPGIGLIAVAVWLFASLGRQPDQAD